MAPALGELMAEAHANQGGEHQAECLWSVMGITREASWRRCHSAYTVVSRNGVGKEGGKGSFRPRVRL